MRECFADRACEGGAWRSLIKGMKAKVTEFPRPRVWQDKVYRSMCDLANSAHEYLKESDDPNWRKEVENRLKKAVHEALSIIKETDG